MKTNGSDYAAESFLVQSGVTVKNEEKRKIKYTLTSDSEIGNVKIEIIDPDTGLTVAELSSASTEVSVRLDNKAYNMNLYNTVANEQIAEFKTFKIALSFDDTPDPVKQPVVTLGNISNSPIGNTTIAVSQQTNIVDVQVNIPEGTTYKKTNPIIFAELNVTSDAESTKQFKLQTVDGSDLGNIKFSILDSQTGSLPNLTKESTVTTDSFKNRLLVLYVYNDVANEAINKTFELVVTEA